jgi:hypothetical protein
MKNCLNERTLLLLHDGEGSVEERAHIESCLNCARRYRQLTDEIKDVVSILKHTHPPVTRKPAALSPLRWSLAAGLVMGAFLLGRMTTAGMLRSGVSANSSQQVASAQPQAGDTAVGPAYGLYIDNLIGPDDDADGTQVAAGETWNSDSDGL